MNLTSAFFCVMAVVWLCCGKSEAAPELANNVYRKFRSRPLARGYTVENPAGEVFGDYGERRFGKREQYDDYGLIRYGRRHE
ncbi:drosulfakinin [Halictus rubicundus]|uniref:drosulfakinin n=1 Tax=Halictus rubicundus TaxID=77578 RepID=UPI00403753A2